MTPGCVTAMVNSLGSESLQDRRSVNRQTILFKTTYGLVEIQEASEVIKASGRRTRGSQRLNVLFTSRTGTDLQPTSRNVHISRPLLLHSTPRSKERQNWSKPFPYAPGVGYLSVLFENWKLRNSYERVQLAVSNRISSEEEIIKHKPKFGYGSRLISERSEERTRPHSVAVCNPRPHSRRSRSTSTSYGHKTYRRSTVSTPTCYDYKTYRRSTVSTPTCHDHKTYRRSTVSTPTCHDHKTYRRSTVSTPTCHDHKTYRRSTVSSSTSYDHKTHRRSKPSNHQPATGFGETALDPLPRPVPADQWNVDRLVIDGTLEEIFAQRKLLLTPCEPLLSPNSESNSTSEMLSPPGLPGGGLRRETTSFGVYSNLASHSRREPTKADETRRVEPLPVVTSGLQLKLIQAIKRSDIEEVRDIFNSYPDLKLQFVDENDRTVLHHCFDMQKRRVNCDILKLLLDKNPSMINYCKNEAPVLHNAVRLGNALSVFLLLKHGADVNIQYKRTFRTALHEAVLNGRKLAAEILLSNGANTTVIEKDGRYACDLCKENIFQREDFDTIEDCISDKRLEIHEVSGSSSVQFNNIGVTAQLSSAKSDMVMLVKRQSLETSKIHFSLLEEEDIVSDVFTCHVLQNSEGASARVSLPLFDKSFSSREEIIVKTGSGQEITPNEMQTGKHGLVVEFDTTLSECESFVCICRPKVENWQVSKGQTVLGSVIDDQVRIHINKNSFNNKTSLSLQVIELPEDVDIKEDTILASTPFYKIDADQKVEKDITIELPKPTCFDVNGQCVVLAKSGPQWRIMDMQADDKRNTVSFIQNQLPVISTVAVIKPESSVETICHEIDETFKLVSDIKYRVCFLCLTKRVKNTRKFTVVVECCEVKVLDSRRRYWKGQGYQEQQEKDLLAQIGVQSKQAFKVVFYDSAILRKDPSFVDLEFHRKRDNIVKFTVELKGKAIQFINGRLYIYAVQVDDGNNEEVVGKEPLASMDINLLLNQIDVAMSSSDSGSDIRSDSTRSVKSQNVSFQSDDRPISRAGERRQGSHFAEARPGSRAAGRDSQTKKSDSTRNGKSLQSPSHSDDRPVSRAADRHHTARVSDAGPGSQAGVKDSLMKKSDADPQIEGLKKVQASLARAMKNIDPVAEREIAPVETTEKETELSQLTPKEDDISDVFLSDVLLDTVIEAMGEDWYKIYVLSGVAFSQIEEAFLQSNQTPVVKKQLFRKWRDQHQNREDIGLPLLLGALYKGGCRNIATTVQIKLKNWYAKSSEENEFRKWVAKAYADSDLFVPSDYPKPMSDSFLVLMSDELPPKRDLARALHITDTTSDEILENRAYLLDGIKVMKLLTLFRDRTPRGIDALDKLIACLGNIGYGKLRNYAIKCSQAWLKRTATRKDDPFRYQVDALLNKLQ